MRRIGYLPVGFLPRALTANALTMSETRNRCAKFQNPLNSDSLERGNSTAARSPIRPVSAAVIAMPVFRFPDEGASYL